MANRRKSTASISTTRKRGASSRRPSLPQLIQRMSTRDTAKRAAHAGRLKDALARLRAELLEIDNDIAAVQVRSTQDGERAALGIDDAPTPASPQVLRDIGNVAPAPTPNSTPSRSMVQQRTMLQTSPHGHLQFVGIAPRPNLSPSSQPVTTIATEAKDATSYESVQRAHNKSSQLRAGMHNAAVVLATQPSPQPVAATVSVQVEQYPAISNALSTAAAAMANSRSTSAAVAKYFSSPPVNPVTPYIAATTAPQQSPSFAITPTSHYVADERVQLSDGRFVRIHGTPPPSIVPACSASSHDPTPPGFAATAYNGDTPNGTPTPTIHTPTCYAPLAPSRTPE